MPITERLQIGSIRRVGDAAAPERAPRSCAGLFLKYDPKLTTFVLVDMNQPDPDDRPRELGGIAMASEILQQSYGLSQSQADEALGRSIHSFGNKIDLSWVVRIASTEPMGTADQAGIYIDGIENPFIRVYAHMLLEHATGSGQMPVLQPGMQPQDAEEVERVLASFGIKMPIDPGVERVAALVAELGASAPAASGDVIADITEIERLARQIIAEVEASKKDGVRELVPQLQAESLAKLASQMRGTRIAISAISRAVKENLGS